MNHALSVVSIVFRESVAGLSRPRPRVLRFLLASLVLLVISPAVLQAQTLERSQLGDLSLEFADVTSVATRPGHAKLMQLATLPGDGLSLQLPFPPNRIEWLVGDGAGVEAGQVIARIYGPELEHWLVDVAMLKERFTDARGRYERNKPLYLQQALSADKWQTIMDRFHALRLEQQHVNHVLEWMQIDQPVQPGEQHGSEQEARVSLLAPHGGLVLISAQMSGMEPQIATLIAPGSLRLMTQIAEADAESVVALGVENCELSVAQRDTRVGGFSRRVWSEPANHCVAPRPGLRLSGVPLYRFAGYAVPREALLSFRGLTYLALERPEGLELVRVEVAGEDRRQFYVSSEDLSAAVDAAAGPALRALVRSNSAVQGLLLGLGED